jgi:polysaccharide chain length determinant protein (PEP-CTERM system associated)
VLPGRTYAIEDFAGMAWRRKWALLIPLAAISAGTAVVAHYLPNKYRSETVILVVPQQVPETYVQATVTSRIEDRLQSISQQILSRTRLERIIRDFDLYAEERRTGIMEDVVEGMRTKDIKVDVLKGDAFRIAYVGKQPQTVMKVTERLASLFIEENLRDRELLAEGTNQFLTIQLDDARRRLIEQEKKLEEYRSRHSGELPSQAPANLQQIQNIQMQVQALVESLNRDVDRRLLVERELADLAAVEAQLATSTTPESDLAQLPAALRLSSARKALSQMELRLTAEHPDIVRMRRVVAGLEQSVASEELAAPLSEEAAAAAQTQPANRLAVLRSELESLDDRVARKHAEEGRLRKLAAAYQSRLEAIPSRETELAELMRDYSTLQSIYADLLGKNEQSKIAANLERRQIGEQFKVLDAARPAERPFSPDRTKINLLGGLGGLLLGLALAVLLEYRDSSFRSEEDVTQVLDLAVLAQIPRIVMVSGSGRSVLPAHLTNPRDNRYV